MKMTWSAFPADGIEASKFFANVFLEDCAARRPEAVEKLEAAKNWRRSMAEAFKAGRAAGGTVNDTRFAEPAVKLLCGETSAETRIHESDGFSGLKSRKPAHCVRAKGAGYVGVGVAPIGLFKLSQRCRRQRNSFLTMSFSNAAL